MNKVTIQGPLGKYHMATHNDGTVSVSDNAHAWAFSFPEYYKYHKDDSNIRELADFIGDSPENVIHALRAKRSERYLKTFEQI